MAEYNSCLIFVSRELNYKSYFPGRYGADPVVSQRPSRQIDLGINILDAASEYLNSSENAPPGNLPVSYERQASLKPSCRA